MASYSEGTETQGSQDVTYHPKDAVGSAVKATGITGGAGLFISAIQNTLSKQNVGAFGVFTRTGGTIAVFGMLPTPGRTPCAYTQTGPMAGE